MSKAPFSGKVIRTRFTDEKNTTIEVIYDRKGKNIPYYLTVDESDPKYLALLDEGWNLERISEDTVEWNRAQNRAINGVISHYVNLGKQELKKDYSEMLKKEVDDRVQERVSKNGILRAILENNESEETLFKIKLAIFDLDDVKKTKNRSKKLKIRKAKTILGTLAAFWDLIENENE